MSNSAKVAGAMGGKAARACDGCLRRRARWYCAADDAFLCQGCDTSVHSANPLARRHERLRLRPSSPLLAPQQPAAAAAVAKREEVVPAWFKRKARTPRPHVKSAGQALSRRVAVPEVAVESSEERKAEEEAEEEEQLLYRVPIFDPALAEFCSPPPLDEAAAASSCCKEDDAVENPKPVVAQLPSMQYFPDRLANFGPTDAELTEFAADMEALIGRGLDDSNVEDSFYMETLGLIDSAEDRSRVKVESDGAASDPNGAFPCGLKLEHEASAEMLDIDFDCGSPQAAEDEGVDEKAVSNCSADAGFLQRSLALRLDYEAIIESWGSSPWTDGERPYVNLDDNWPHDYLGVWTAGGKGEEVGTPRLGMDGGREARVTRYREKRRTRLFSKKIRYEVRKLNAEKRPRMKGRFVKRTNTGVAPAVSCLA